MVGDAFLSKVIFQSCKTVLLIVNSCAFFSAKAVFVPLAL